MSVVSNHLEPAVRRQRRNFPRPLLQAPEVPMGHEAQYSEDTPEKSLPPGLLEHRVESTETITSLAVKYGMSPHDIRSINRLHLAAVFPGQLVLVRDPSHACKESTCDDDMTGYPATSPGGQHIRATRARERSGKAAVSEARAVGPQVSPPATGVERTASAPQSPFLVITHDMSKPPLMATTSSKEFLNDSCFCVKVLYITRRQGLVPGTLESTPEYIRFIPHPDSKFVREFGTEALSLFLEYEDLLTPMSQRKPPSLKKNPPSLEPGFAGHKASGDNGKGADSGASAGVMGAGKKTDSESLPVFLGLRAQLVFGVKPTPETIAFYWFAVMPQWIDGVYDHVYKHAREDNAEQLDLWEQIHHDDLIDSSAGGYLVESLSSDAVQFLTPSHLLSAQMAAEISKQLPLRLQFSEWECAYSTYEHGMSLNTLYRRMTAGVDDANREPCVLVVRDCKGYIFGCYSTDAWIPHDTYFGGGESFVFKAHPIMQFYKWTHKNKLFQIATDEHFMIGGGHTIDNATGAAAIWIGSDLLSGCSNSSQTYGNDCLASSEDFTIDGLEIWRFVSED